MNELKPEDVMKENDFLVRGISKEKLAEERVQALREGYEAILREKDATIEALIRDGHAALRLSREKDAEIERLKNSITFQVLMPDDKMEEIKAECLARVELDIKAIRAEAITEFAERVKKFYANLKGKTVGGSVEYHIDQIVKEMKECTDERSD